MSLFSSIGKVIGSVGKVTGKVLKTVAPVASIIPGVGTIVSGAAGVLGNVLSPEKSADVVTAVQEQGEIKVDKLENTIAQAAPQASPVQVQQMAVQATKELTAVVPTATINDSQSAANVDFMTKAMQWVKAHLLIVGAVLIGGVFFFTRKKGGRKRW